MLGCRRSHHVILMSVCPSLGHHHIPPGSCELRLKRQYLHRQSAVRRSVNSHRISCKILWWRWAGSPHQPGPDWKIFKLNYFHPSGEREREREREREKTSENTPSLSDISIEMGFVRLPAFDVGRTENCEI